MEGARGYTDKLYTSAVGYLPASDPQVIIYVVVDSASGWEIWGSTVAVPVFAAVAKQVARIMNLKSDKSPNSGYTPCTRPLPDLEEEQKANSPFNILPTKTNKNNVKKAPAFSFQTGKTVTKNVKQSDSKINRKKKN